MNEKQIIKKLTLLKTIQPPPAVLEDMKKNIYLQVQADNNGDGISALRKFFINMSALLKSYRLDSYGITFALLLVFLAVSSVFLPNHLHKLILYSKLALASNQYERASIALADTTNRFGTGNVKIYNANEAVQSIALANTELSHLKLKGENGKYTAQQCQQIYQKYLNYLENENQSITKDNNQSLTPFKSQLSTYEELAEIKLHMYNKL